MFPGEDQWYGGASHMWRAFKAKYYFKLNSIWCRNERGFVTTEQGLDKLCRCTRATLYMVENNIIMIAKKELIMNIIKIMMILFFRELMRGISCVEDFIGNCSSIEERHVFQVLYISFLRLTFEPRGLASNFPWAALSPSDGEHVSGDR